MFKIGIILFPGTNCEDESFRAIKKAGLQPEFFRWNDDLVKLKDFDGYFIPGGFSYEDRIRSGAIAGRDPLMAVIKEEAEGGKPVIGICNGAQILVESGLIPGLDQSNLGASLAWNNHGYLNIWVNIKNEAKSGRSAFNDFELGHHFRLPIAHGEGRFVMPEEILNYLKNNDQIVFRYCDNGGDINNEFPVNPNGAIDNIAGLCNPAGNVLALMPHPERTEDGIVIFESLRKYLEKQDTRNKIQETNKIQIPNSNFQIDEYKKPESGVEMLVDLIITDNEAETLQIALNNLGFIDVKVRRLTHWEIESADVSESFVDELVRSGELLNTNKELVVREVPRFANAHSGRQANCLLVRYVDDFEGAGRLQTLKNRFGYDQLSSIKKGTLWQIESSEEDWQKILDSNILANPFSQESLIYC